MQLAQKKIIKAGAGNNKSKHLTTNTPKEQMILNSKNFSQSSVSTVQKKDNRGRKQDNRDLKNLNKDLE